MCGSRARLARSATKHRISKEGIRHVISRCGLAFEEPAPRSSEAVDDRLVILGDADGNELEVMAVEGPKGELIVIHAMELREKHRAQHQEARQWRL